MSQHPENHGKLWTNTETNNLMKEIQVINIKNIAKIHKRTENAIFLKIIREAAKLCDNDNKLTLYDLSLITSLKISNLIQGFKKINYTKFIIDNNIDDIDDIDDNKDDIDDNKEDIDDIVYNDEEDEEYIFNSYYIVIPSIFILSLILLWKSY